MAVYRGDIMKNLFSSIGRAKALRITALAALGLGVSACTYDGGVGIGYASGGGYSGYDCDPYSPFDNYYNCDYGYGFSNIGYGGGWYSGYYYPGYGMYLFDNYGRRYGMQNDYRRYWAQRRYDWNRDNRHENRGYQGGQREGRHQDYQPRSQYDGRTDGRGSEGRGARRGPAPAEQNGSVSNMPGRGYSAGPDTQPYNRQGRESRNYSQPAQPSGAVPDRARTMESAPQRSEANAAGGGAEHAAPSRGGFRRMEGLGQRRNPR